MNQKEKITLAIPTYNRYDLLDKCIESAEAGSLKPDNYIIINNGKKNYINNNSKVKVYNSDFNLGVAASWNQIIKMSDEIRIISNDDSKYCFI